MKGMTINREALETPEHQKRMARIFLFEARKTVHRDWAFTLLNWAAERRLKAASLAKQGPKQKGLFD